MPHRPPILYRALTATAVPLLSLATPFGSKLRRGHAARRAAAGTWARWAALSRDRARPLVWMHAPSVGEGLQAEAVLKVLRARHASWQFAYSFFSPSAEAHAQRLGVDASGYLPYDRGRDAEAVLDALTPSVLVFVKLDLWPALALAAAERRVPVVLAAATVSPVSGRLRAPVRALLRSGYEAVTAAGAVSDDDAARLAALGTGRSRIEVLGDPRYDSVAGRVAVVPPGDPVLALIPPERRREVLVAGSTWPADEDVLLDAFRLVRAEWPSATLILAPHEPTPEHLARLARAAVRRGLPAPAVFDEPGGQAPLRVVNRVGVLSTLYGAAGMAWVGGGFGSAGLHSVLEPAAWGVPVLFGPRYWGSRDAQLLLSAGGGRSVPGANAAQLAAVWKDWLTNDAARREAGRAASALVEGGRGAAERQAALIERFVS